MNIFARFIRREDQKGKLRGAHRLIATGYLVSRVVHDVLNNIASANGYARLLLDPTVTDTDKQEMLRAIEELHGRSADLLRRIGRFSLEPGREFKPVDIHKAIDDVLELTNPIVRYSKMTVEKVFNADVPFVMACAGELEEVFVTLVLNSVDAVSTEGKLTIRTDYAKEDGIIKIVFSDTGSGISRDDLKRLGESFFSTKGRNEKAGLGLAMAYGIISRHNGRINAESAPGKGATFTVSLPIIQPDRQK
ncbi:MAG: ATP-binding protein [Candidatus Omnitrophica bacterium]|jgi:hypothetical protein|nr:ATP-binding protein [Candidatus Omnitrophota bacterium]MDD5654206.1 ATP-binding protein [Candidatus Omnitrophota bacterium]